jgi:hypothetical protein
MRRQRQGDVMKSMRGFTRLAIVLLTATLHAGVASALEFPGPSPGTACAKLADGKLVVENKAIRGVWNLRGGQLGIAEVVDRLTGHTYALDQTEAFVIELADGSVLPASEFESVGEPDLERLATEPQSIQRARQFPGWKAAVGFTSADRELEIQWEILLRDQSNYLQQRLVFRTARPLQIRKVTMLDIELPSAEAYGDGVGSPVAAGNLFVACEHPMADNRVDGSRVICEVPRHRILNAGESWMVSSVVGVVPEGQLRRGFLYYLERERARPYHPLFYYISWFDIAYHDRKMNEELCLKVIEDFGREMADKRGVKPDLFVFDDGWDDDRTLWQFHDGFPKGFKRLREAASQYDAPLGTWISPWGGYSKAKVARLKYGKEEGFEMAHGGFSLAGPTYFARFRDVCVEHIENHGVRYFKFDGVGKGSSAAGPGEEFGADIEAMLDLIRDLRQRQPDLFFNTTVGTWPSPYWLLYSDSIWRGGGDLSYHGVGTSRQQWITFRDMAAYRIRVLKAPLYPLNSIKSQGVMFAKLGLAAELSQDLDDLIDDIRMAAASGSQLQEFFVTPSMMSPEAWDAAAEAIGWMRKNTDVLIDTHWVGGDPGEGEVYGYASWSPRKGILVVRNPSDRPAEIAGSLQAVFELPEGSPGRYRIKPLWQKTARPETTVDTEETHMLQLAPYEMVVLEALQVVD